MSLPRLWFTVVVLISTVLFSSCTTWSNEPAPKDAVSSLPVKPMSIRTEDINNFISNYARYGRLWKAVAEHDSAAISALLAKGANINTRVSQAGAEVETTPLLIALDDEDPRPLNVSLIRFLLDNGAKPNARNESRATALELAIQRNENKSLEIVRLLISKGANVNSFTTDESTLLDLATTLGQTDIVRILLQSGAKTEVHHHDGELAIGQTYDTLLVSAAGSGKVELAQLFLERGGKINAGQGSALHTAVVSSQPDMVRFLLEHGADPNITPPDSDTNLQAALDNRPFVIATIDALLKSGANPNLKNQSSALFDKLVEVGRPESLIVANRLLDAKARLNPKKEGVSLLFLATLFANAPFSKRLLNLGVNPNSEVKEGYWGFTPLRALARFGNWRDATIEHDFWGRSESGLSPQQLLKQAAERDVAIARMLFNKGARLQTGFNRFALLDAAEAGNLPLVRLLIERGAPVNVSDREQLTLFASAFAATKRSDLNTHGKTKVQKLSLKETEAMFGPLLNYISDSPENGLLLHKSAPGLAINAASLPLGRTPILAAAANGHAEIVQLLLRNHASVNVRDRWGETPLIAVTRFGRSEAVRSTTIWWHSMGEKVETIKSGTVWAETGDNQIVQALIAAGSNVQAQDLMGQTALHHAARLGPPDIVSALLKAGALVDTRDKSERTPLALIAMSGRRILLDNMEAAELKRFGTRKTQIILRRQDGSVVTETDEKNAHQNLAAETTKRREEMQGKLALTRTAAIRHDLRAAKLLLKWGAKKNLKDKQGLTALAWARKTHYKELASVLTY